MATVDFILALEQRLELVPLRKGWWIAFGAPRQRLEMRRVAPRLEPAPSLDARSAPAATASAPSGAEPSLVPEDAARGSRRRR